MSIGIKGSGEEILEQHPKLDTLQGRLEEISSYWNGEDDMFIGGDGVLYAEEASHCATEAIEKVQELKTLLEEINITY